jgi:hypothetical protein
MPPAPTTTRRCHRSIPPADRSSGSRW